MSTELSAGNALDDMLDDLMAGGDTGPQSGIIDGISSDHDDDVPEEPEADESPVETPDAEPEQEDSEASAEGDQETTEDGAGDSALNDQVKAVLAKLEAAAAAEMGLEAPVPAQQENAAPEPAQAPQQAPQPMAMEITDAEWEEATESREGFQKILGKAVQASINGLMPQIAQISLQVQAGLMMEQDFYRRYPYMKEYPGQTKKAIYQAQMELSKKMPNFTMEHVVERAGELISDIAALRKALEKTKTHQVRANDGRFAPSKTKARGNVTPGQQKGPETTRDVFKSFLGLKDSDPVSELLGA